VELLLDGFEDDVDDKTGSAHEGRGPANAAVVSGGGAAQGGFHLLEGGSMALGDRCEIGEMAITGDEKIDQTAIGGGIENFVGGKEGIGNLAYDLIYEEGEARERGKFHDVVDMDGCLFVLFLLPQRMRDALRCSALAERLLKRAQFAASTYPREFQVRAGLLAHVAGVQWFRLEKLFQVRFKQFQVRFVSD
jgi:hypothetical protein